MKTLTHSLKKAARKGRQFTIDARMYSWTGRTKFFFFRFSITIFRSTVPAARERTILFFPPFSPLFTWHSMAKVSVFIFGKYNKIKRGPIY